MITIDQALEQLRSGIDRRTVEIYVARAWIKPIQADEGWQLEEIDIARIDFITHLRHDLMVNDEAMDIVLSLLDQLYDIKNRLSKPEQIRLVSD